MEVDFGYNSKGRFESLETKGEDELLRMMSHLMDEGILHRDEEYWKRKR